MKRRAEQSFTVRIRFWKRFALTGIRSTIKRFRRIGLVIHMILIKRSDFLTVKRIGRSHAGIDNITFIQFQFYIASNRFLRGINKGGKRLAKRREPLAEIHQFRKLFRNKRFRGRTQSVTAVREKETIRCGLS